MTYQFLQKQQYFSNAIPFIHSYLLIQIALQNINSESEMILKKSFIELVSQEYQRQKQQCRANPIIRQHAFMTKDNQNMQKQAKTRSKSKRKSKKHSFESIRKSTRYIHDKQQQAIEHVEIEKQPLWMPNRKKKKQVSRKSYKPIIKQIQSKIIKHHSPLYQFYSNQHNNQDSQHAQQISKPDNNKLNNQQQISTNRKSSQTANNYQLNDEQQIQKQIYFKQLKDRNQQQEQQKLQQEQKQQQGWKPSKQQQSMLAIQSIIDDYFMFKSNVRDSRSARVGQLIAYVRDIKGYYFNMTVLYNMMDINQELYKLTIHQKQKYLKCPSLQPELKVKRLKQTRVKMSKIFKKNMEFNE